ncbi:MBL fold metallo-hydrolase [Frigoribacterium sp. CFBP9039]|uniref:MBL fold metallo-hydrolase n=1 Tax=Frigoribacterium sp. CFBP9029 TaxID=3096541 RepID=UPI002A6B0AD4|nr:MBL fold metallo-hydrolase [Frigoribacterium sp. CFBP9039]MDY0945187.1 MBL fold metallo-hydrolase [Frigoribacterium sp. CFBP9039]
MSDPASRPVPPTPVSAVQAQALDRGELPPVEEVRHGVWSIPFPFGDGDFSLGYLVEGSDGALTLIDPGWADDANLDRLEAALREIDHTMADIALVAITHLHADHLGGADAVRRASGARIALHASEQRALDERTADAAAADADIARWGAPADDEEALVASWGSGRHLPRVTADLLLADGDELPIAGRRLRAVHTPGHTAGHLCFVEPDQRLIFTGDHVLPRINPGIGLGGRADGNPLDDYLASLGRVIALDVPGADALEVCPGHEFRFVGLSDRAQALVDHRAARSADAAAALDALAGARESPTDADTTVASATDARTTHAGTTDPSASDAGTTDASLDRPTVWQVAERMSWTGGIASLHGYRLGSALAQTEWHVQALGRLGELRPSS